MQQSQRIDTDLISEKQCSNIFFRISEDGESFFYLNHGQPRTLLQLKLENTND
jgi:hypothetical protein